MYSCYITQDLDLQPFLLYRKSNSTNWQNEKASKKYVISKIFVYTRVQQKILTAFCRLSNLKP